MAILVKVSSNNPKKDKQMESITQINKSLLKEQIRKSKIIKILLIEDNPPDARLIKEYLDETNNVKINLTQADNLACGLDTLSVGKFDLVLLDLYLDDSFGLDTFYKTQFMFPELPIIVLTGLKDKEIGVKVIKGGAQDYLTKEDINNEILEHAIYYAIERKKYENRLNQSKHNDAFKNEMEIIEILLKEELNNKKNYLMPVQKSTRKEFNNFVAAFENLLEESTQQTNLNNFLLIKTSELNDLAHKIGICYGGVQEILEIYRIALNNKIIQATKIKREIYLEQGRLLFLKLLSSLVNYYKDLSLFEEYSLEELNDLKCK